MDISKLKGRDLFLYLKDKGVGPYTNCIKLNYNGMPIEDKIKAIQGNTVETREQKALEAMKVRDAIVKHRDHLMKRHNDLIYDLKISNPMDHQAIWMWFEYEEMIRRCNYIIGDIKSVQPHVDFLNSEEADRRFRDEWFEDAWEGVRVKITEHILEVNSYGFYQMSKDTRANNVDGLIEILIDALRKDNDDATKNVKSKGGRGRKVMTGDLGRLLQSCIMKRDGTPFKDRYFYNQILKINK